MIKSKKVELSELYDKDIAHIEMTKDNKSLVIWIDGDYSDNALYTIKTNTKDLKAIHCELKSQLDCGYSIIKSIEFFKSQLTEVPFYCIMTFKEEDAPKVVIDLSDDKFKLELLVYKPVINDLSGKSLKHAIFDSDVDMIDFYLNYNGIDFNLYSSGSFRIIKKYGNPDSLVDTTINGVDLTKTKFENLLSADDKEDLMDRYGVDSTKWEYSHVTLKFITESGCYTIRYFVIGSEDPEESFALRLDCMF